MPNPKTLEEWIAQRPPSVQKLALMFPISSQVYIEDILHYIVGYTEGNMVMITHIDPVVDYNAALKARKYICVKHLEEVGNN